MTKISIIIPTFNEDEDIVNCLRSLNNQSEKDFEIIVVDDGSTDSTNINVRNLKHRISNITYLRQKHKGPGAARNLGASKAEGKILVFVDADMTFEKNFLSQLIKPIDKAAIKGTFSKDEYVNNWSNVWARCWNINQNWQSKKRHPKKYPDQQPVFRAILKSEFDRVNGFDPGGYDDDWSLSKKLGYLAINAPGAIFYHKNPDNLIQVYKQAKWSGKRNYKLGIVGNIVAILRALLLSLTIGIYKSIRNKTPEFLIFKIVYDTGTIIGIVDRILTGNSSK